MSALFALAKPFMALLDPETAHHVSVAALARLPASASPAGSALLGVEAFGLKFPNPLGLAAGFDKNGIAEIGRAHV